MKLLLRCIATSACCLAGILPGRAQTITDGVILLRDGNSMSGKLVKLGKRREEEQVVYSQVQVVDSAGGVRTYLPTELLGYVKEGVSYKTFDDAGYVFFAKCLVEGSATLFYHPGYGEGNDRTSKCYFFKRAGDPGFLMINAASPFPKTVGVPEPRSRDGREPLMPLKKKDMHFIDFFTQYFKDCQGLVRKIKMEFYTLDDIQAAFEEFNACGAVH